MLLLNFRTMDSLCTSNYLSALCFKGGLFPSDNTSCVCAVIKATVANMGLV